MVEDLLPRNIEKAVSTIELETPDVGTAARQISRRLLSEYILPDSEFGEEMAIRAIQLGIAESNVVNLVHVCVNALGLPAHEYDRGTIRGLREEIALKELAHEATSKLRQIAEKWEVSSPRLLSDAVLALRDSLNSLEEQV